jgi:hypothetical protein
MKGIEFRCLMLSLVSWWVLKSRKSVIIDSIYIHIYLDSKVRGLMFCAITAEFGTSVSTVALYTGFINDAPPEKEEN